MQEVLDRMLRDHVESRKANLLALREEFKNDLLSKRWWTPKGISYFVGAMWPEALDALCEEGKDLDKGVMTKALVKALKCLYSHEVVVLLRHGARLTKPKHGKGWVLSRLFLSGVSSVAHSGHRLSIFKAFVALDEAYATTIYKFLHQINMEETEFIHYLVDIGVNIFALDRHGRMLYERTESRFGVRAARRLKARQQLVNPLFTTMLWRLDEVNIFMRGAKRHRIE